MRQRSFLYFLIIIWLVLPGSCNREYRDEKPRTFSVAMVPGDAGFDAIRLQRIDTFLQSYVDQGILPNAVTFVARHGKVVHNKTYGWKDKEAGIVVEEDNIFRRASQTKAITTVALMTRNQIGDLQLWNGDKFGYGFEVIGDAVLRDILGSEGSYRWAGMYSTDYLIDPQEDLILLLFTNVYPFYEHVDVMYYSFRNLVYQALE